MSIRKTITKISMVAAAFFWASCDNDTISAKEEVPASSESVVPQSSGSVEPQSSESVEQQSSDSVGPESSDSVESQSSDSVEPLGGNSAGDSSWVSGFPTAAIDLKSVRARGDSTCAEHGGLQMARQYEPEWGTPQLWGGQAAEQNVQEEVQEMLKSDKAAQFSEAKKSCLASFANEIRSVCMYGVPMFENDNDIWQYACKDGEVISDPQYAQKEKEYKDAYDAAYKEAEAAARKEVADCDNAT